MGYLMNKMLHLELFYFQRPEISECTKTPTQWPQLKDWCWCPACLYKSEDQRKNQTKGTWTPIVNQQNVAYYFECGHTVWCRLSRLHESTLTSTCGGTQAINNRQPHKGWAWKGSGDCYKQFQNLKKVSEQTKLLDLWNVLYS